METQGGNPQELVLAAIRSQFAIGAMNSNLVSAPSALQSLAESNNLHQGKMKY